MAKQATPPKRVLDAMPDTLDFRDKMYVPTLVEVPPVSDLAGYRARQVPVLDQGREGACTGFGLATVANYLLRSRRMQPDAGEVSARMLYLMAKRYDEWPGEDYEGSSARGAMKGWHKHGVCAKRLWLDAWKEPTPDTASEALSRPLGAYFRVNHKDLVAMHSAISEVGVLYATSRVHQGWMDVKTGDEVIKYSPVKLGGHAFAIVGYDREGFWLQNSWGPRWGSGGLVRVGYGDWLEHGTDVWVARLGAPVNLAQVGSAQTLAGATRSYESHVYAALRPHVIVAENDGALREKGQYGLTPAGLQDIVRVQMKAKVAAWSRKRVLVYAHGGLVSQPDAVQYAANLKAAAMAAEAYPLSLIWRSDLWTTLGNILQEALAGRRDEGLLDAAKDFMLDRLDDTLEPVARLLGGKALWDEMKENARLTVENKSRGAARLMAQHLVAMRKAREIDEIHLVGHSAGAVLHGYLAGFLAANGVKIDSLTLWAPACTMEFFEQMYRPLIADGTIGAFDLYTLDDATERDDDCRGIYHKSLLYLVSGAFEKTPRMPLLKPGGTPLLGLARDVARLIPASFWKGAAKEWRAAPGDPTSDARHHGDFDNDAPTVQATLQRITGAAAPAGAGARMGRAAGRTAQVRRALDRTLARPAVSPA